MSMLCSCCGHRHKSILSLTRQQFFCDGAMAALLGLKTEPVQHSKRCSKSAITSMSAQMALLACNRKAFGNQAPHKPIGATKCTQTAALTHLHAAETLMWHVCAAGFVCGLPGVTQAGVQNMQPGSGVPYHTAHAVSWSPCHLAARLGHVPGRAGERLVAWFDRGSVRTGSRRLSRCRLQRHKHRTAHDSRSAKAPHPRLSIRMAANGQILLCPFKHCIKRSGLLQV